MFLILNYLCNGDGAAGSNKDYWHALHASMIFDGDVCEISFLSKSHSAYALSVHLTFYKGRVYLFSG